MYQLHSNRDTIDDVLRFMADYSGFQDGFEVEKDSNLLKWQNPLCNYNGECFEINQPKK